MIEVAYDTEFDPPAPVLPLQVVLPGSGGRLQLLGLVDTGADITLLPEDVAARQLPVAGTVGLRGVTGDIEEAILYRAELTVGNIRSVLLVAGFGQEVIVGRDVLERLVLSLDGPSRKLTVSPLRDA